MARWLDLPRIPEPEVMDDSGEVEAYAGAAAEKYFSAIDDSFVALALRLVAPGRLAAGGGAIKSAARPPRALDIGCGPGQIVGKLAARLPEWSFAGVDRSPNMIRRARGSGIRAEFLLADGCCLPFADGTFDLVTCNSVLHHLERPAQLLAEIARVADPAGAVLLRDLRRPSRLTFPLHVRWHGRAYSGLMYKLYRDSVRAAYTLPELQQMLRAAPVPRVQVFRRGRTHLGFVEGLCAAVLPGPREGLREPCGSVSGLSREGPAAEAVPPGRARRRRQIPRPASRNSTARR